MVLACFQLIKGVAVKLQGASESKRVGLSRLRFILTALIMAWFSILYGNCRDSSEDSIPVHGLGPMAHLMPDRVPCCVVVLA